MSLLLPENLNGFVVLLVLTGQSWLRCLKLCHIREVCSSILFNRGFAQCGTHLYAHDFALHLGFLFVQRGMEKNNKTCCSLGLTSWQDFNISTECVCVCLCSLSLLYSLVLYCELNKKFWDILLCFSTPDCQKQETSMAGASMMTCKIGLIWGHMKILYGDLLV